MSPPLQLYEADWYGRLLTCRACTCRDEARRPVPGVGPVAAEIMVIGQNPGEDEDIDGIPFIGAAGKELDIWLGHLGLARAKIVVTNLVKCHTQKNRVPKPKEVEACKTWLREELRFCPSVQVLFLLGKPALEGVIGQTRLFGAMVPWWVDVEFDEGRRLHVVPLAHPAYLLRAPAMRPVMYQTVLPAVRAHLVEAYPDVCQRAAL